MRLCANAFSSQPGACFRAVYAPSTGHPMRCPGQVVTRGWWQDAGGYWFAVDACAEHASHLSSRRPGPGDKFGRSRPPFPVRRKPSDDGPKAAAGELAA